MQNHGLADSRVQGGAGEVTLVPGSCQFLCCYSLWMKVYTLTIGSVSLGLSKQVRQQGMEPKIWLVVSLTDRKELQAPLGIQAPGDPKSPA